MYEGLLLMIRSFILSGYLYSAPSRNLFKGALSPTTAKEKCLKKLAEGKHIVPSSKRSVGGSSCQVDIIIHYNIYIIHVYVLTIHVVVINTNDKAIVLTAVFLSFRVQKEDAHLHLVRDLNLDVTLS